MAFLWSLVVVDPLIILSTILFGIVSIAITFFDKTGDTGLKVARGWARSLLFFVGVRVQIDGLENLDPRASYVICSNHLSYMDTPVILTNVRVRFRFLAKRGLFQIPFLGTHLSQAGHIPVPRQDPRAAVKTMNIAAETIRARGISMLVFPEGGRSHDGALQPFKEGAAYIALKAGVPILPVALIGTRAVLAFGTSVFHPGPVRLRIGQPISTDGLTVRDREQITDATRQQIIRMLES